MRNYTEPTSRNLLRRPLILGVPLFGMLGLTGLVLTISVVFGTKLYGNLVALTVAVVGYGALRVLTRFAKPGWEEAVVWFFERKIKPKNSNGKKSLAGFHIVAHPPDTLDEVALISEKEKLLDKLLGLKTGERLVITANIAPSGAILLPSIYSGTFNLAGQISFPKLTHADYLGTEHVYSLYQLPTTTDPLWLFSILSKIKDRYIAVVSIQGVNASQMKRRIEASRRNSARGNAAVSDIDADVTFEESSVVLKGLSRGDETVVEASLVLISFAELELDDRFFCKEKIPHLTACSALGLRRRFHRSHFVRAVTACDLIPNILDPMESGPSILRTPRGGPLYFSPDDSRLEALHWLVVGASGSGKSFFTGLVLMRMMADGPPMSVLFLDHNRSYRRFLKDCSGYSEPQTLTELREVMPSTFHTLCDDTHLMGIELSDLPQEEKKTAIREILGGLEAALRSRKTSHPIYLVLDECWNFMRDEPLMVQRAFREFRKLNGAVVAVTQSLSDFLTDQSGQSIFQNAPIRVLLRQGEDVGRYQGILGLNSVELAKVRSLRQEKGVFSECLIKTPFLSRLGRLYPNNVEYETFRTDNLREELVQETQAKLDLERKEKCVSH